MSEYTLQLIAFLKLIWVACFAYLYGLGGMANKWIRRFVGSVWLGLGVFGFSHWVGNFHWWYLGYPILLMAALHLGYGGDNVLVKVRKRAIYGLALGVAALPLCFGGALWYLFGFHCLLCLVSCIIFGAFNIARNARDEETIISVISTLVPLFMI